MSTTKFDKLSVDNQTLADNINKCVRDVAAALQKRIYDFILS